MLLNYFAYQTHKFFFSSTRIFFSCLSVSWKRRRAKRREFRIHSALPPSSSPSAPLPFRLPLLCWKFLIHCILNWNANLKTWVIYSFLCAQFIHDAFPRDAGEKAEQRVSERESKAMQVDSSSFAFYVLARVNLKFSSAPQCLVHKLRSLKWIEQSYCIQTSVGRGKERRSKRKSSRKFFLEIAKRVWLIYERKGSTFFFQGEKLFRFLFIKFIAMKLTTINFCCVQFLMQICLRSLGTFSFVSSYTWWGRLT